MLARLRRPTAAEPTRLAVLADVHLAAAETGTWKVYHRTEAHLRRAVAAANARDVDGVIVAGDLTRNGDPAEYDRFDELATFDAPTVAVPGNHDLPTVHHERETMSIAAFEARYAPGGELPFRTRLGGIDVFGLDSHAATPGEPAESWAGRVDDETVAWLDAALRDPAADPDATLAVVHHNLPATGELYERFSAALPLEGDVPGFPNSGPLVAVLREHDVPLVVTGHLHFPAIARTEGVREFTLPAVSSFPHAMVVLEVDDGGTTVRLVPLADAGELVDSLAHGYEKDRVLLSAAQLATVPLADDFA